jgi:hypothetical protein
MRTLKIIVSLGLLLAMAGCVYPGYGYHPSGHPAYYRY